MNAEELRVAVRRAADRGTKRIARKRKRQSVVGDARVFDVPSAHHPSFLGRTTQDADSRALLRDALNGLELLLAASLKYLAKDLEKPHYAEYAKRVINRNAGELSHDKIDRSCAFLRESLLKQCIVLSGRHPEYKALYDEIHGHLTAAKGRGPKRTPLRTILENFGMSAQEWADE